MLNQHQVWHQRIYSYKRLQKLYAFAVAVSLTTHSTIKTKLSDIITLGATQVTTSSFTSQIQTANCNHVQTDGGDPIIQTATVHRRTNARMTRLFSHKKIFYVLKRSMLPIAHTYQQRAMQWPSHRILILLYLTCKFHKMQTTIAPIGRSF